MCFRCKSMAGQVEQGQRKRGWQEGWRGKKCGGEEEFERREMDGKRVRVRSRGCLCGFVWQGGQALPFRSRSVRCAGPVGRG